MAEGCGDWSHGSNIQVHAMTLSFPIVEYSNTLSCNSALSRGFYSRGDSRLYVNDGLCPMNMLLYIMPGIWLTSSP